MRDSAAISLSLRLIQRQRVLGGLDPRHLFFRTYSNFTAFLVRLYAKLHSLSTFPI